MPTSQHQATAQAPSSHTRSTSSPRPSLRTRASQVLQRMEAVPASLTPADVLTLQRAIGNRATGQLLQAKLKLGPAGDRYEQEADRVAKQVVQTSRKPPIQHEEGGEEAHQASRYADSIADPITDYQRSATPVAAGIGRAQRTFFMPALQRDEIEDELQAAPTHGLEGGDVDAAVARSIQRAKGGGQPLDENVRGQMEQGFGASFGGVRMHTRVQGNALNRSLNATALPQAKAIHTADNTKYIQREGEDDERPAWQRPNRVEGTERGGFSLGANRQRQGGTGEATTGGNSQWQGGATTGGRGGFTIGDNRRWQTNSPPTRDRGGFAMGSRSEEAQKAVLIRKIRDTYGINIDQNAGVNAVRDAYPDAPEVVRDGVRARDWTLQELQDVDQALSHYGALLGANRPGGLAPQSITTFSRLEQGIDDDSPGGILDNTTAGETFTGNISMFDQGHNIRDFAVDKANPTPEELRQGFRGTIEHELSHGLIESLQINGQDMIDEFADQIVFWDTIRDCHYSDPLRPGSKARRRELAIADGQEAPITLYGATDADEDLAESLMFYFENPVRLEAECPQRFAFIQTNIQPILNGAVI